MSYAGNFSQLIAYLEGKEGSTRVHIADLLIDEEILKQYSEEILAQPWVSLSEDPQIYWKQYVACFVHMGFDYVPLHFWIQHTFKGFPAPKSWIAHDAGLITTQAEYDSFCWDDLVIDYSSLDIVSSLIPPHMAIVVVTGDLQDLMDVVVGTTAFLLMIYDDLPLLTTIIDRWYALKKSLFERVITHEKVGAIWTCADFGSKTDTLFSPDFIRENLLPWYKEFSQIAHNENKHYWFHSCGNLYTHHIIEDLIEEVRIDAFHSFQDSILPVTEFVSTYGDRVATLGGVDIDALCLLEEDDLRAYIRNILHSCIPHNRFALGTGNSVASYIPFKNFLILLEEGKAFVVPKER